MNYEAKIGGLWYPVTILETAKTSWGNVIATVEVKPHKVWDGGFLRSKPFCSNSMGGPVDFYIGDVAGSNICETTDDPLEIVYPKKE